MADLFGDIIEANKINRTINAKTDALFEKINFDVLGSIVVILTFLAYVYYSPISSGFMQGTFLGKLVTSFCITSMIMIYALNQFIQIDSDFAKLRDQSRDKSD